MLEYAKAEVEKRYFLEKTWLLGERVSCPIKSRIAQAMKMEIYRSGELLPSHEKLELCLLYEGEIAVYDGNKEIKCVKPGDFWGEESIILQSKTSFAASARMPSIVYRIPAGLIEDIPIVQWKLLEVYSRRNLC